MSGVPNMWPAGQKWSAKPLGVALDLSTKKNEIYVKIANIDIFIGNIET